ncbi:MAG: hypothetical protein AAF843_04485 [Bacteroidota bacterium]
MEDIQQSELRFYLPLIAGYLGACLVTLLLLAFNKYEARQSDYRPAKPWLELVLSLIVVVAIFIIGRAYTAGFLIPSELNPIAWMINNLIIYSPIFIFLLLRKQPTETLWLSKQAILLKIFAGVLSSLVAVLIFTMLRGEAERTFVVIRRALTLEALSNFVAVFLEGVALAFLFIRLKWTTNLRVALLVPAVLFALGHLPGMLAEGDPWWHMVLMSTATGLVTIIVLYTCYQIKDILWIGIVHYLMDVAISAF